jgi:hypothetical protein
MINSSEYITFWEAEYLEYRKNLKNLPQKWQHLERLHIISQLSIQKHFFSHYLMLREALVDKNLKESLGQILRIILVLPGHILRRLPI